MSAEITLSLNEAAPAARGGHLLAAVGTQRRRLSALASDLGEAQWHSRMRCPLWDVHGILLHIIWGNQAAQALLVGDPFPFEIESLDPRVFPNAYVAAHNTQPHDQTLSQLQDSTDALLDTLADLNRRHSDQRFPFFYPWPTHWHLIAAHLLWDSWLHERDIVLPLHQPHATTHNETRLALAYGLLIAGFTASSGGTRLEAQLTVGGIGTGRYQITIQPNHVTVQARDPDATSPRPRPTAEELADAIAGRGAAPERLLARHDELTTALSIQRDFFLTPV
jgi:uncharacterized protein (TIGR03083 family)